MISGSSIAIEARRVFIAILFRAQRQCGIDERFDETSLCIAVKHFLGQVETSEIAGSSAAERRLKVAVGFQPTVH